MKRIGIIQRLAANLVLALIILAAAPAGAKVTVVGKRALVDESSWTIK
jgi:hypothetical protein